MPDLPRPDQDTLQRHLRDMKRLLSRQQLVEDLTRRQQMPHQRLVENITHRQNLARLQRKLDRLHPADIAFILEALPLDERLYVWDLVRADKDGDILLEVSDAVRTSLIGTMDPEELKAAAESLDADEVTRRVERLRASHPAAAAFIADRAAHYRFDAIAEALRTPCPPG